MRRLINWFNILIKKRKALKRWQRIVTVLAAVITFATTYALILPAITVEKDTTSEVAGMYLENSTDGDGMQEDYALEPAGVTIAADMDNAVTFAYSDDDMTATAVFSTDEEMPEGTELVVNPIVQESEEYENLKARSEDLLDKEFIYDVTTCSFYDFALFCDNVDVTPKTGLVDIHIVFRNNTVEHIDDMLFAGRFARPAEEVDGFMTVAADTASPVDGVSAVVNETIDTKNNSNAEDELVSANSDDSSVIELADGIITSLALKGNDLARNDSIVGILAGNVDEETKAAAAETAAEIPDNDGTQEESEASGSAETDDEEISTALPVKTLKASGSDYTVTLSYDESSGIPDEAVLDVSEIAQDSEEYQTYLKEAKKAMGLKEEETLPSFAARFFDIKIMVRNQEFTPETGVSVEITYNEPLAENPDTEVNAVHFADEKAEAEVIETNMAEVQKDGKATVEFTAESFSVYGVIYTVDFHYEMDGKQYEFGIPGGGFVSLEHMVEALGLARSAESAGEAADLSAAGAAGDAAEQAADSISLNSIPVSEETKAFVADVAGVEFSSPGLVWVGKADPAATVGDLKSANGLEVQYSAELTEEQIAEINAQTVDAGDWALISMQPFTSEESLTVTMKNGDQFVVKVTDAQISTHVITADGEDYVITVTYGPEAGIPEGATLEAEEIPEGTDQYETMLEQAQAALNREESTAAAIRFSRFFDVTILDQEGRKIEPESPVAVTIRYADAIDMNHAKPMIVHFAEDGIEVIRANGRLEGDGQEGTINVFEYEQGSFSGIGTITESAVIEDGQYFVLVSSEGKQYALATDGRAVEVNYYHQTKQVTAKDGTDENSLLWNVRGVGYGYYTFTASNGNHITINDNGAVSSASANILAQWVGYDPWTQGSLGDGYNLYNAPNYFDENTWTSLGFSDTDLSYVVGGETPAHIKLARYSLVTSSSGQVPSVSTYTGREVNPSELDEWLMSLFDDMPVGYDGYHKTAEVYDYENRIYQIDFTAQSNAQGFASDIDLAFSVDMSNSMLFPSVLKEVGTIELKQSVLESTLTKGERYFVISDVKSTATVNAIYYDYSKWKWMYEDASKYARHQRGGNNQDKEVGANTTYIAGPAVDTGTYTLYKAEQGYVDYIDSNAPVWDNPYNRLADMKQSLTMAFNFLDIMQEKYHARIRVGWNGFARDVKYDNGKTGNDQENFDYRSGANNHGLINLAQVDYNSILSGIVGAGKQTGGGTRPDKAFEDAENYMGWDTSGSVQKYLILITDGAPQGGDKINGQSSTPALALGEAKKDAKHLRDTKGVNIISIGLSTEHVDGANDLFTDISGAASDGGKMIYQAKDGDALKNSVVDALRILVSHAVTVGTIKDTIDPAFYPVSTDGTPLKPRDKIDLNGKLTTDTSKPYGVIDWDNTKQCWTVEWSNQDFVWPDEEHPHGWHGRVLVKAKENFLGGNDISTNEGDATLDVINAKVPTTKKPDGTWNYSTVSFQSLMNVTDDQLQTRYMETPHVNVDELEMTKNDTEWTVYLDTKVDPGKQMEALFNEIKVMKVVTDGDHEMAVPNGSSARDVMVYDLVPTEDGNYSYEEASSDAREQRDVDQAFFYLKDLFSMQDSLGNDFIMDGMTAEEAIARLLAGERVEVKYQGYGHGTDEKPVGTIILELKADPGAQVNNLTEHAAAPVGNEVEKYILSAEYKPAESTLGTWYWNTGTFGTKDKGKEAEDKTRYNTHIINVIKRVLTLRKTDSDGNLITDPDAGEATFEIYQKDGSGNKVNAVTVTTSGGEYTWDPALPDADQEVPGDYWADETTWYIREVTPPKGYAKFDGEITVTLGITDTTADIPNNGDYENVPFDWDQTASLSAAADAEYVSVTGTPDITIAVKNDKSVDIIVIKTNTDGEEIPGAQFTLTRGAALQTDITVIRKGGSADNEADHIPVENGVFIIPEGGVTILGLGAGDYTLTETEAPDGYVKTLKPVTFTIGWDGTVTYTNAVDNPEPMVTAADSNRQYTIQNEPGAALPATGGPGISLIYFLGIILTCLAGAGLMMRKRCKIW